MTHIVTGKFRGIPAQDGAGVKLTRVINQPSLKHQDPFLMLDEFRSDQPDDYIAGFPPHPHRGFCTLTYMLAGNMQHQDSVGNEGIVGSGGVQWMKAARGIIHSEMPQQKDGLMWGFQLWINLPSKEKMSAPEWADFPAESIPEVQYGSHQVRVIAGSLAEQIGPIALPERELLILDLRLRAGETFQLPSQHQDQRLAYVYKGNVELAGQSLKHGDLVTLDSESDLSFQPSEDSGIMLLAAQPIGEPIAQYGPFVMNTSAEIEQAIQDYQKGQLAAN